MPIRMNKAALDLEKAKLLLIMDVLNNLFYTKIFSLLLIYIILIVWGFFGFFYISTSREVECVAGIQDR